MIASSRARRSAAYCVVHVVFGPRRISRWETVLLSSRPRELWPGEVTRTLAGKDLSRQQALRLANDLYHQYREVHG